MKFNYLQDAAEAKHFTSYLLRNSSSFRWRMAIYAGVVILAIAIGLYRYSLSLSEVLIVAAICGGYLLFLPLVLRRRGRPKHISLTVDETGIRQTFPDIQRRSSAPEAADFSLFTSWNEVSEIVDDGKYIGIISRGGRAFAIPYSIFESDTQRQEMLFAMQNYHLMAPKS